MGCRRCEERRDALKRALDAGLRGETSDIARELSMVGRTLREDVRNGELARATAQRLATLLKR